MSNSKTCLAGAQAFCRRNKKLLQIIIIPIILMPLPIVFRTKAVYCAYILMIMTLYWMTECLPIGVTSILPVLLYPLFGIASCSRVSQIYFEDIQMLFFGALTIVIALQNSGLPEKLALKLVIYFGTDPKWLLLSVMSASTFLSCWMKNTAVCSMMLPIVEGLVTQIVRFDQSNSKEETADEDDDSTSLTITISDDGSNEKVEQESKPLANDSKDLFSDKKARNTMIVFLLAISYTSSIGGNGTLVGGTPNLILKGYLDKYYEDGAGLNFITFLAFSLPYTLLLTILAWIALCLMWLPTKSLFCISSSNKEFKMVVKEQYESLGPYNWQQISAGLLFVLLVILWVTRDLFVVPGWSYLFGGKLYVSDSTPVMLIMVIMFIWPKKNPFRGTHDYEALLCWNDLKRFPWDVQLLGGGSLAIAFGFQNSGLTKLLALMLHNLMPYQKELGLLIVIFFNSTITEFMSNVSLASIMIPIADGIAKDHLIDPIYYLISIPGSVSLAFMLPMGTPANAIIFSRGHMKLKDMILSGLVIKVIGVALLYLAINTWFLPIFPSDTSYYLSNSTLVNYS